MPDIAQYFSADLQPSATGDLQLADGLLESQQRILRRLLTNPTQYDTTGNVLVPGDYIWEPNYGAGLPSYIGKPLDQKAITALIRTQMYLEDSVSHDPQPQIVVTPVPNGIYVQIQYVDVESGQPVPLNFTVTP